MPLPTVYGAGGQVLFHGGPFSLPPGPTWPTQPTDEPWPPEPLAPEPVATPERVEAPGAEGPSSAAGLLPSKFGAQSDIALAPLPGQDQATLPPGAPGTGPTGAMVFMPTSFLLVRQPTFGFYRPAGGMPTGGALVPGGAEPGVGADGEELPVATPVAGKLAAAGGLGALVIVGLITGGAIKT